ncbi:hypothetical protein EKN06_06455 [Croceicoccus ponticola]|uniref:Uncharacterized protein n=1 Tax=Croceicoccus ponticola TaxID=2217664 RepID=A0A437GZ43_9SPHN|nr:hypothetical protein [Croceicoccus ponticola]RVQ67585.1 hypothetical protein EKN06_06455 [Croceicoccus ponticola]
MNKYPVSFPSGYATAVAIGTRDADGNILIVDDANPLPVSFDGAITGGGGGSTPQPAPAISGSTATSATIGPFAATPGLPIIVSLTGIWAGDVQLLRSVDGGVTKLPLTIAGTTWGTFGANACEPVWTETEQDVTFYLRVELASGTVDYRLAQ